MRPLLVPARARPSIPALLALLLAASSLLLASRPADAKKKEKPKPAPAEAAAPRDTSEVLVRLGDRTITRADVQRRLDEMPEGVRSNFSSPEGRQQLLDRMIEEQVWLITAEKNGVADRPKVQQQIASQRRDILIRTYLTEVMATNPAPSDSELKAYYDAHQSEYTTPATVTVRHIQTKTRAEAVKVLQAARAKQDWNKLCMRYSADTLTRGNGGNLGPVTKTGQFPVIGREPALAESAFALGAGRIGGPYKSSRGWHVLKVDKVEPEGVQPFEQARAGIGRQIGSQRSQDYYRLQLDQARKRLGITPDSAAIKRFVSQKRSAREMFQDAQAKGSPDERIAAYRALLAQYPDSEVSAQAAFMVGFTYSEELKNYDQAEGAFRDLLARYPKSELATSAQWMIDHMRSGEAPSFIQSTADSIGTAARSPGSTAKRTSKP